MERYGRTGENREALEAAGREFLVNQARLGRTTSYTEMNTFSGRVGGGRWASGLGFERWCEVEETAPPGLARAGAAGLLLTWCGEAEDCSPFW